MPNKKRASRWPNNLLQDILLNYDVDINKLPGDVDKGLEYLFGRILPNQRKVILWYYKDGYTMKEITGFEDDFSFDYVVHSKEYGIKNMIRLSYILTIGYNRFLEGYHVEEYPVSLFFDDLYAISYNALARAGITTVGDVLRYSKEELMNFDRVHELTIRKIENKLKERGLSLKLNE